MLDNVQYAGVRIRNSIATQTYYASWTRSSPSVSLLEAEGLTSLYLAYSPLGMTFCYEIREIKGKDNLIYSFSYPVKSYKGYNNDTYYIIPGRVGSNGQRILLMVCTVIQIFIIHSGK